MSDTILIVDDDEGVREILTQTLKSAGHSVSGAESVERAVREAVSSGVMMIPIPARGVYRRVEGVDAAGTVPGVEDVRITAKPDQLLVPLPEGASYLGFIFARGGRPEEVVQALRAAHTRLRFVIDREIAVSRG